MSEGVKVQSDISEEVSVVLVNVNGQMINDGSVFVLNPSISESFVDVVGSKKSNSVVVGAFLQCGPCISNSTPAIGNSKGGIGLVSKKHQGSSIGNSNESPESNEKDKNFVHLEREKKEDDELLQRRKERKIWFERRG